MTRPAAGSRLTLLDGLVCAYLALPLLCFCTWFKWPVAAGLAALTVYGFRQSLPGIRLRRFETGRGALAAIAAVALAWAALAGIGHFFYANLDWITRDAVLRDLAETSWPPQYGREGTTPLILRAPVGFYLPAAAAGAALGLRCADVLLYLWSAFGFGLVLCAAATLFPTRRERAVCGALMLGFGGLDLVGYFLMRHVAPRAGEVVAWWPMWGAIPRLGEHIEWWALFAQYSSNSTLMFWVPNHALPAWLGLLLALRHWGTPALARMTPMLAAAIPLWSPLSALGLAPFFLIGLNWRRDLGALFTIRGGLPFIALAGLVARYVTMDTQSISRGWAMDAFGDVRMFWVMYGAFCLLEFGLLALLLLRLRAVDLRVTVAVVVLLALPFYRFGPGNDLVMRCSIPALLVLALAAVRPLAAASDRPLARALLMLVLGAGALGAAQEPARALLAPRWALTGKTLVEVAIDQSPDHLARMPPNYVGRLDQPGLAALMREPGQVRAFAPPGR
jgi:hypothetical protein